MADLSHINAAEMTKIIGSDSDGVEGAPVGSSTDGYLKVTQARVSSVTVTDVNVSSSTSTLIAASNANRKLLIITNTDSSKAIRIQYGNTPTLTAARGIQLVSKAVWEISSDNLYTGDVYGFSESGTVVAHVTEGT